MPASELVGVKRGQVLLVAATIAALAVVAAIVVVFFAPWPDGNHQEAVQVARSAGVPAGVTPGPPQ
jgi:hypothetical protein